MDEDKKNTVSTESKPKTSPDKLQISVLAVSGLIVGVIALLTSAIPIINNLAAVLAIVALGLGIGGVVRSKKVEIKGKGIAIAAIIISLVSLAVVYASQQVYKQVIDSVSNEVSESVDRYSGKATAEMLGNDIDVKIGKFEAVEGDYSVETKLPVTVTNKMDRTASFSITIEAVNAEGVRLAEDTVYASDITAGQTAEYTAFDFISTDKAESIKNATFKVLKVAE